MKNSGSEHYDAGVLSNPLSFIRNGYFGWGSAGLNYSGGSGYYWSSRSTGITSSRSLNFSSTNLTPQEYGNGRSSGYAVRYVAILANPSTLSLILAIP